MEYFRELCFRNLTVGKKFMASLILFLILPLSFILVWLNQSLLGRINEQNLKTNLAILKQTKMPIDAMIQDLIYVSLQVIGNDDLQRYLGEDSREENREFLERARYTMAQLTESKDHITRLSVFDGENLFLQSGAYLEQEDTVCIPRAAMQKGRPYWMPAALESDYVSAGNRIYEVAMVRAVNNIHRMDDILGYVRLNVDEKYLCSLYSGIWEEGTLELFIVNGDGEVVSAVHKELLNSSIAGEDYYPFLAPNREGWLKLEADRILSFYYIDATDWYVIKIDEGASLRVGTMQNAIGVLCLLLILLFGIVFSCIQKKYIITPVKLLSQDVSRFREGQYRVCQYTASKDEIGMLNRSFIEMGQCMEELIERVYKSQLREKEAQLRYLQSQINPHFLYNTLDSIRWMAIKEKQYELAGQIEALANLFRHALNQGKEMTTVQDETAHLKDYLLIQKNKFGDRLTTEIRMEERTAGYPVLNLILQPLVENAIVHGLRDKLGPGYIRVSIHVQENCLVYEVEDNGLGTDEKTVQDMLDLEEGTCHALALGNINRRIKYKYGESYGVTFQSRVGAGTKITVRMPYEEETDEAIDCG